jgi:hypothetical protein
VKGQLGQVLAIHDLMPLKKIHGEAPYIRFNPDACTAAAIKT